MSSLSSWISEFYSLILSFSSIMCPFLRAINCDIFSANTSEMFFTDCSLRQLKGTLKMRIWAVPLAYLLLDLTLPYFACCLYHTSKQGNRLSYSSSSSSRLSSWISWVATPSLRLFSFSDAKSSRSDGCWNENVKPSFCWFDPVLASNACLTLSKYSLVH